MSKLFDAMMRDSKTSDWVKKAAIEATKAKNLLEASNEAQLLAAAIFELVKENMGKKGTNGNKR